MLDRPPAETVADARGGAAHPASDMARLLAAEALGSGLLAFAAVAAGLLGERYAGGNIALAAIAMAAAAAASFAALTWALGGLAASCFNPGLALGLAVSRRMPLGLALLAGATQMAAAILGVMLAHMVTNTGLVQTATAIQSGMAVWLGEFLAAALVIFVLLRLNAAAPRAVPLAGALVTLAAVLATPSLSLGNPAITLARALTDSFASIRLADAWLIVACQFAGAVAASLLQWWLFPAEPKPSRPLA